VPCRAAVFLLAFCAYEGAGQVVDYACVPRFRADPSYIRVSEASGGQMLLLDRKEIANPAITRAQIGFNDQTFLRASGTLGAGFHEFTAPVDSSVRSLQFTVFAECVKAIIVSSPSGVAAEGEKLSSGRIIFLDAPEQGLWRVKLSGTGYFSVIAQGKSDLSFAPQRLAPPKPGREQSLVVNVTGPVATAAFRILARSGAVLNTVAMTQARSEFTGAFTPPSEPFRIAVEGNDTQGAAFRRVHPPLLDARP